MRAAFDIAGWSGTGTDKFFSACDLVKRVILDADPTLSDAGTWGIHVWSETQTKESVVGVFDLAIEELGNT